MFYFFFLNCFLLVFVTKLQWPLTIDGIKTEVAQVAASDFHLEARMSINVTSLCQLGYIYPI